MKHHQNVLKEMLSELQHLDREVDDERIYALLAAVSWANIIESVRGYVWNHPGTSKDVVDSIKSVVGR